MFRAGNQTGFVGALQATLQVEVHVDEENRILISGRAGDSGGGRL
jgi:hypothetical protein